MQFITGFTDSEALLALREEPRTSACSCCLPARGLSRSPEKDARRTSSPRRQRMTWSTKMPEPSRTAALLQGVFDCPPNSQGSVDSAFKRQFGGNVEVADYAAEMPIAPQIDRIRLDAPSVVYVALRADDLRHFDAYKSAGLFHRVPSSSPKLIPSYWVHSGRLSTERSCRFAGRRARKPHSQAFVEAFGQRYGRLPSFFAMQGCEGALMLGEAFRTANRSKASRIGRASAHNPTCRGDCWPGTHGSKRVSDHRLAGVGDIQ